jgi:hypothetical protein
MTPVQQFEFFKNEARRLLSRGRARHKGWSLVCQSASLRQVVEQAEIERRAGIAHDPDAIAALRAEAAVIAERVRSGRVLHP